jgi:hypothetical protein
MSRICRIPYGVPLMTLALIMVLISGYSSLIASPFQRVGAGFDVSYPKGTNFAQSLGNQGSLASISDMGIGEAPAATPSVTVDHESLFTTLALVVGVLVLVILLLIFISVNLVNLVRVREGKEAYTFGGTLAKTKDYGLNPYIASFGTLVVTIVALFVAVPILRGVGLSPGYKPDQPIWFSHKIHAGQYQIDCQYCHTGASKGKNAWIPAVSVCMNCHKGIAEGKKTGTKEIAKIYDAYNNNVPIQWVRVHNLPDLAYFNHQQHVVVGKVECQECHGPIQEMDVVEQFSTLSMGWCLNCHRTKEVDKELYKKIRPDGVHTVKDQGGFECARCHY